MIIGLGLQNISIQIIAMKNNLQKKIAQYRQQKSKKGILQNLISQKRKNLEKLIGSDSNTQIQKQNDFRIENYAKQIDFAHQKYLEDMDQLQNTKFKIIQLKGTLDALQLQINLQQDNLSNWDKSYKKEVAALDQITEQLKIRLVTQKSQKTKMEEERCQRHLQHVQKLTAQKQELINRSQELLQRRKNMDLNLKKLKDNFEQDYKKQKQLWAKSELQRRQKWQAKKLEEITENTLRGLEPEIQRIVNSSKKQIIGIQQKYESLKNDYKREMNLQYERNVKQIRKDITDRIQEQKMYIIQKSNQQYRKLTEKLVESHEQQKLKIKYGRQAEVRELQEKRKRETQEFMFKNKDNLLSHLSEIKLIKANYQQEIKQLDTSLDKMLQKQEKAIQDKYNRKLQSYRQEKRKQLEQKVKAFHVKQKQASESQYQDLVQNVAVQNQSYESQLKQKTQAKIKQFKQKSQNEIKNIRKTLQSLMNKQNQENQFLKNITQVRQSIESQYNQLQRQCEYLKKKQLEYQAEVVALKAREGEIAQQQSKQLSKVSENWQQQIQILIKKMNQLQIEMETQQKVMKQKGDEQKVKYTGLVNDLDKTSLQVFKKLNQEIQRARKQKQMKTMLNGKLYQTKKKMRDLQLKKKTDYKL